MERALAALPPVHAILRDPALRAASNGLADRYRTILVRRVVEEHRQKLLAGSDGPYDDVSLASAIVRQCIAEAEALQRPFPRRVINGTGVVIHTNLGRAPLGELADAVGDGELAGYTDLEWDAESQSRGSRDGPLQRQLQLLTGADGALAVNNCASALVLALHTLASGREVLVSRSELVEIGGSFRVPEIMEASGCRLREVGTTNRTRISDYERHAVAGGSVLLKVHQSNFVQRGFVEQTPIEALVALGRRLGIPVIEDNGSGLMVEEDNALLADEPHVLASLGKGVGVVCCSADKLFGGIQAGIVLGRAEHLAAMRKNPLSRALRLDKVRISLLDQTLKRYLAGEADRLPLWRLVHTTPEELESRFRRLRMPGADSRWLSVLPVPLRSRLGGGTNPEASFESLGIELRHRDLSVDALRRRFAARAIPIVGYVQHDRFLLDLRTLFERDLPELQRALDELGSPACGEP